MANNQVNSDKKRRKKNQNYELRTEYIPPINPEVPPSEYLMAGPNVIDLKYPSGFEFYVPRNQKYEIFDNFYLAEDVAKPETIRAATMYLDFITGDPQISEIFNPGAPVWIFPGEVFARRMYHIPKNVFEKINKLWGRAQMANAAGVTLGRPYLRYQLADMARVLDPRAVGFVSVQEYPGDPGRFMGVLAHELGHAVVSPFEVREYVKRYHPLGVLEGMRQQGMDEANIWFGKNKTEIFLASEVVPTQLALYTLNRMREAGRISDEEFENARKQLEIGLASYFADRFYKNDPDRVTKSLMAARRFMQIPSDEQARAMVKNLQHAYFNSILNPRLLQFFELNRMWKPRPEKMLSAYPVRVRNWVNQDPGRVSVLIGKPSQEMDPEQLRDAIRADDIYRITKKSLKDRLKELIFGR